MARYLWKFAFKWWILQLITYKLSICRRRTCYIAPERFKTRTITEATNQTLTSSIIPEESAEEAEFANSGELLASMDIFSAGCVLIELFTEGTVPFNFSQLLMYR